MRAIAERLVGGVPTTAEPNGGASGQAKGLAFGIQDLKIAFHAQGSVVIDSNFRGRHFFSLAKQSMPTVLPSAKHKCGPNEAGAFVLTWHHLLRTSQYFGTDGSTSSDQARMPPFRLRILRKPALRKKSTASAERFPLRQCATISRDESSSWTRRVSSPRGRRCPWRLQIWYSWGSRDRKSTRLNSSHQIISYAVFCLKKKKLRQMSTPKHTVPRGRT